jgi:hypothetical protein
MIDFSVNELEKQIEENKSIFENNEFNNNQIIELIKHFSDVIHLIILNFFVHLIKFYTFLQN